MRIKILSPFEIEEAKLLNEQGISERRLAIKYEVAKTTIHENLTGKRRDRRAYFKAYFSQRRFPSNYRYIPIVVRAVKVMRKYCDNSREVAKELDMPLEEVNYIWAKHV